MSPRPGPRRPMVSLRLGETGVVWIAERARLENLTKSEMMRLMLAYAVQKMPKGWRP